MPYERGPSLPGARLEDADFSGSRLHALTPEELTRVCIPPNTPVHPTRDHTVQQCLRVILNEEWEHHRYAVRDLDTLDEPSPLQRSDG